MEIENSKLKIVFFGTPDFAVPALEALIAEKYNVVAVITQPDKPTGRKKILSPPPAKVTAQKLGLMVLQPTSLKTGIDILKFLRISEFNLGIVAAYGKIIPKEILDIPKYGFVNVHPSLLPKYRGPSPIQTAILNGAPAPISRERDWCGAGTETGVTIMLMDEKIDHGPILKQKIYNLQPTTHYKEVEKDLAKLGAKLLVDILPKYISGKIKPEEQEHHLATFTKMFKREDGRINWSEPAEKIYNRIRALNPEPGTWTTWKGKVINIPNATMSDVVRPQVAGTVVKLDENIAVATKKCYLILKSIQLEGGKEMDAKSFLNGHPDFLNSILE